ncbi:MAG: arylsulfatase A-like enzyme [Planctomycetota bacterium]|jgi:arylsulfatase A-like enzyme
MQSIKVPIATLAVLSVLVACSKPTSEAEDERPNVLLVIVDDLSDWVGCLNGHRDAHTPHIDSLAESGVLFSNAHAQATICNPSRTSFMLGLRPTSTGIYENDPWFRDVPELAQHVTLLQHFKSEGYLTLSAGKIFHSSESDSLSIDVQGPTPGQGNAEDRRALHGKRWHIWDYGARDYDESEFVDATVAAWAEERLAEEIERPFFMAVGFYKPHVPLFAPKRLFEADFSSIALHELPADDLLDVPPIALSMRRDASMNDWFQRETRRADVTQAYLATTSFVDEQVGRVVTALQQSPYAENTVVVLVSDHGMHLGEKTIWGKRTLWERSTHVPFIIAMPGEPPGIQIEQTVELVSLYPTLLELCGLPKPSNANFEGPSLAPLLKDPTLAWDYSAITSLSADDHAVRTNDWRYIRYANGSEELYDRRVDTNEWTNLAGDEQFAAKKNELEAFLPTNVKPNATGR